MPVATGTMEDENGSGQQGSGLDSSLRRNNGLRTALRSINGVVKTKWHNAAVGQVVDDDKARRHDHEKDRPQELCGSALCQRRHGAYGPGATGVGS